MQVKQVSARVWHVAQFALQAPPHAVPAAAKNSVPEQVHSHALSVSTTTLVAVPDAPKVVLSQALQCF